jgi:hypothetical protein
VKFGYAFASDGLLTDRLDVVERRPGVRRCPSRISAEYRSLPNGRPPGEPRAKLPLDEHRPGGKVLTTGDRLRQHPRGAGRHRGRVAFPARVGDAAEAALFEILGEDDYRPGA